MKMDSLVGNEFVEFSRNELSSSLSNAKYDNPISASGTSKNGTIDVTTTRSRKFNIRDQCSRSFIVVLIISVFSLVFGYYSLTQKLTASSQLAENLSLQLANVVNRIRVMEAAAIAQENKLAVKNQNLSLQLTSVETKIKSLEAGIMNAKDVIKFTENVVMNELHQRLAKHDNVSLELAKNFSGADQKILEIIERSNKSLEEKSIALLNVSIEMEKMHLRVVEDENVTSQLASNVSGVNGQVLDIKKSIDALEAAKNTLQNNDAIPYIRTKNSSKSLKKLTGFMNISAEIVKMSQRLGKNENLSLQILKNISDVDRQALNMTKRIDAMEAAKEVKKCRWLTSHSGYKPPGAVVAGKDNNGEVLYVARVRHYGALIPGKLVPSHQYAYILWEGREIRTTQYLVLCDCTPRWLPMMRGSEIPVGAFVAGENEDGESLYVGRAEHDGSLIPGMVLESGVCYISFANREIIKYKFDILVL